MLKEADYHRVQDLTATLDQDLAAASASLLNLARTVHSLDLTELVPPDRAWMVTHLFFIQDEIRGAENHVLALMTRMEAYRQFRMQEE